MGALDFFLFLKKGGQGLFLELGKGGGGQNFFSVLKRKVDSFLGT